MPGMTAALALLIADPLILGAQQSPPTAPAEDTDLIEAARDRVERMIVPVAVQGSGPYSFLIDTGSQRTVLSTAVATRLALTQGPSVRIVGVAGVNQVATAHVDEIAFGQQLVAGLTVPLLEDRHMGADGIIGTDSLQGQRVVLDFVRETIAIGTPREIGPASGYDIVVRARRRSGRLILTNALIDGVRVDVVVDTGAQGTIGNRALQRALRKKSAGVGSLASVTGQTLLADFGVARKLKLDTLEVSNVTIAFADAPAFAGLKLAEKPAIFLGMREMRSFRRIAIDFASRKVFFDVGG
ncbi:putative aspartyl protease [Novosphingobium chloroacetimidivorans]|uniref:Putative aspartyl protease n=1 Tax=Novosphingobium chloroacetimidivorans TaxID=1428314 RepID=A0A7W7KE26_9SPHN|nr:retropepsin-like aspartic protease [Novosphingobium chloroacetimidivorans]MBB4860701.1 putative aspartyl protease [Novosphingobium chloroacetimidivorans]